METNVIKKINPKKIIIPIVIVIVAVIVGLNSFVVVDAGHTGVVVTMGKVNEGVLQEGVHAKIPFVQSVEKIDNVRAITNFSSGKTALLIARVLKALNPAAAVTGAMTGTSPAVDVTIWATLFTVANDLETICLFISFLE